MKKNIPNGLLFGSGMMNIDKEIQNQIVPNIKSLSGASIDAGIQKIWDMCNETVRRVILTPRIKDIRASVTFREKRRKFMDLVTWFYSARTNQSLADADVVIDYTTYRKGTRIGTQKIEVCPVCNRKGLMQPHWIAEEVYWCRGFVYHIVKPLGGLISLSVDKCNLPGEAPQDKIDWDFM